MATTAPIDGAEIYYKDWGKGQPIVFSRGWPLGADAFEGRMTFLASRGYRCFAHDRRGHGRSSQPWDGYDMDTFADGIAIAPSHNSPSDGGFKCDPPHGGPADSDITSQIQSSANGFLRDGLRDVKRILFARAVRTSTIHRYDYLRTYVGDLENAIDLTTIPDSGIAIGVDPMGGAGISDWPPIAEQYGLNLTVVNQAVDPTFRFMAVDWDGKIRMDLSSPYAMQRSIGLKHKFDLAFASDTDHARHATYKRPNLLLHDPERLVRILTNRDHPVQLVLAGKAHPQDLAGQDMIRQWIEFSHPPEVRSRAIFLSDYDALMAEHLMQGVDLWVNTPKPSWEASGTSGMKVLVNGGLNLLELDGWWAEAYSPEVGWALGDMKEHGDDSAWDADEAAAEALYGLLDREVVPEFYKRDDHGIPRGWVARLRESMARLMPLFPTNRVVRQYTEEHYLPAALALWERAKDQGALGVSLVNWKADLAKRWPGARFGSATVERKDGQLASQSQVFLQDLDAEFENVELYAEGQNGNAPPCHAMKRGKRHIGSTNAFVYSVSIPATRPPADYTPRVIPRHSGAFVPVEAPFILGHESPSWR